MTYIPDNLLGCDIDPVKTAAVCQALADQGKQPIFGDAMPQLKGWGIDKSVLLFDAEMKLFGKYMPSWNQLRGTCVSQGFGRAWQDALWYAIAFGNRIGLPVQICNEPIYAGSRINVGKGNLGNGDGSCGAWAALYGHNFGLNSRQVYGNIDLTTPHEDWACQWGAPHHGVPQSLLDASADYKADACMKCESIEDVRDALAAGYGVARCAKHATHGTRSIDGFLDPVPSGGHCQEIRGVYVDIKGDLCFIDQQSWNGNGPVGGGPIKLQDGREVDLPEGASATHSDTIAIYLNEGEVWAVAPPYNVWKGSVA